MKIAIEGCGHGELDKIYETVAYIEDKDKIKVDLLICCGDFQAARNKADLQCMAVPDKFKKMNTFYKYYSGEKKAPVLTIFIGGNHEASNYLQELAYGGWVAPNIYYLGYAGVVQYGGVRICGLSGIFNSRHYHKGHFEITPYNNDTLRSAYHVRSLEVFRLKQLSRPIDVMISHDWPRGIYNYGNAKGLIRRKSYFKEEVETNTLGSPAAEELLHKLKPYYWFSAHLHVKFAAAVKHKLSEGKDTTTKFLALDKCLPKRKFLQILELPHDTNKNLQLEVDPEWLCVLKSTDHLLSVKSKTQYMPGPGCEERWDFSVTDEDIKKLTQEFDDDLSIPRNFEREAPVYNPQDPKTKVHQPAPKINSQTTLMCAVLEIRDPMVLLTGIEGKLDSSLTSLEVSANPDEISLDDNDDDDDDEGKDIHANFGDKEVTEDDTVPDDDEDTVDDTDDSSVNFPSFIESFCENDTENESLDGSQLSTDDGVRPLPNSDTENTSICEKNVEADSRVSIPFSTEVKPDSDTESTERNVSDFKSKQILSKNATAIDKELTSGNITQLDSESETDAVIKDFKKAEFEEPKVKKFKRRNQAIYTTSEDDD